MEWLNSLYLTLLVVQLVVVVVPLPILFLRLRKIGGRVAANMALSLSFGASAAMLMVARMLCAYSLYPDVAMRPLSGWGLWLFATMCLGTIAMLRIYWF